jgi:hypothetical protein
MNIFYRWLHDKRIARVEKESISRSESPSKQSGSSNERSQMSDGRMVSPSNEIQIPDPWL